MTLIALLAMMQSGDPQPKPSPSASSAKSSVAEDVVRIVDLPPTTEVTISHRGPYWTVGPVVSRVQKTMTESGHTGTLFIRYGNNQSSPLGRNALVTVGFQCSGDILAPPGFTISLQPERQMAVMDIEARRASVRRDVIRLTKWVQNEKDARVSTITECFCGGTPPICEPVDWTKGPSFFQLRATISVSQKMTSPPPHSPRVNTKQTFATRANSNRSTENDRDASSEQKEVKRSSPTQFGIKANRSVRWDVVSLFQRKDFTMIAELVIPREFNRQEDPILVANSLMRILAVADGIAQIYPQAGESHLALHRAIQSRLKTSSLSEFTHQPLPLAPSGSRSNWLVILKKTDDLLGAIAVRAISAEEANRRLCAILDQVIALQSPS